MPKSSRKIKMSQKQKQSTKQSVIVNVKNVINERRRRAKPAPAPKKETRDTVTLQPKASMFANNLLTGNVSRYVQPLMSFAVAPPQFQPLQSAIMDKPIAKVVPPKQQPDVFAGEETNPYDVTPSYTPKPESSSSSGFRYAPQPPPPPSQPAEEMGPAQAFGAPAVPMAEAILPEEQEEKHEVVPQAGAPHEPEAGQLTGRQAVQEWIRQSSSKYGGTPTNTTMRDWLEMNVYGGRGKFPENIKTYTKWSQLGTDGYQKLLYENRGKIQQGAMKDAGNRPWPVV